MLSSPLDFARAPKATYHVLNGHTLGYINPANPSMFGVLQGDISMGHDPKNGPVALIFSDELRPATLADFERFRVDPTGHIA